MKRLLIKVCGLTDGDNIRAVEQLGVDLMGFIFYPPSPRCICSMPSYQPAEHRRVGVFVNETKENVLMFADRFGLCYVQLHGNESPEYCRALHNVGLHLIKTFSIASVKDFARTAEYEKFCDYFLFDTKAPVLHGGSGKTFDWNLLRNYRGNIPFLLSGGIHQQSASAIRNIKHPYLAGVDLNSRFEISPGIKDINRLSAFIKDLQEF